MPAHHKIPVIEFTRTDKRFYEVVCSYTIDGYFIFGHFDDDWHDKMVEWIKLNRNEILRYYSTPFGGDKDPVLKGV